LAKDQANVLTRNWRARTFCGSWPRSTSSEPRSR